MKRILVSMVIILGTTAAARAEVTPPNPACFNDPSRWGWDRAKEAVAEPGQRFMADMRKCDATLAASIEDAVRYDIHEKEAQSVRRNEKFVLAAYGAAWALVALAALIAWLRLRKVTQLLAELEARVPR